MMTQNPDLRFPKTQRERAELLRQLRKAFRILLLALLAAVLVFSATPFGQRFWDNAFLLSGFGGKLPYPLSIHVIDVEKADALLIECEGHAALLDAGTSFFGEAVSDYLSRRQVGSLDYAIVSHPDQDHIGGMAKVLSETDTKLFVRSPWFSDQYEDLRYTLRKYSIPERIVSPGETMKLGGATLEILGPLQEYDSVNDSSLVIRLRYKDFTALFCGDAEKAAEKDLVDQYGDGLQADLLKVAHHGSKTSSTKKFLKAVSPKYAVISVGPDRHEFPDESVVKRLKRTCLEVYQTDADGNIVFSYGENGIEILTENGGKFS